MEAAYGAQAYEMIARFHDRGGEPRVTLDEIVSGSDVATETGVTTDTDMMIEVAVLVPEASLGVVAADTMLHMIRVTLEVAEGETEYSHFRVTRLT